jgi:hypothetical protein
MTGKKGSEAWHRTTVVLQPEIYRQAVTMGIDISDACNRALAGMTGTEYHPLHAAAVPAPPPVIIARDGSLPRLQAGQKKAPSPNLHPVINADDPAAPARVALAKAAGRNETAEQPVPGPAPVPAPAEEKTPAAVPAAKKATTKKRRGDPVRKRSKGDGLKTFFSERVRRTDEPDAAVSKDELYERFVRFCHEHRIAPLPDRRAVTTALKNQFSVHEKNVDGIPSWTGIRLV